MDNPNFTDADQLETSDSSGTAELDREAKQVNEYVKAALWQSSEAASSQAFKLLPFVAESKDGLRHWAPKPMAEKTSDQQHLAYLQGVIYGRMYVEYLRHWAKNIFDSTFEEVLLAFYEAHVKSPKKGSSLRAGFFAVLKELILKGARSSQAPDLGSPYHY